ncbi:MAG: GIY-YIG nuclease family protein [Candidatus Thiodiazotropha endolucinida]
MSKKKTASFDKEGIGSLAKDKPVIYKIEDKNGNNIYTGVAKRGRVEQRLNEHLYGGPDPIRGANKVRIKQKNSIKEALESEARIIKRQQPSQNKKGK